MKLTTEQIARKDKNCLLKFTKDDVLLKLRLDNNPDLVEIEEFLEKNSIMEADYDIIKNKLEEEDEGWFKIAPNLDLPVEDDKVSLKVTKDKLQALLTFVPGRDGKQLQLADVKDLLAAENITYGINQEKIKQILKHRNPVENSIVAEGKEAEPGQNAYLIYHFEEKKKQAGTLREDGTMDFHSLDLINNVRKGEKIVTKVDPVSGKPGIDVYGNEITPPQPKDVKLPRAKNTVHKENDLYAVKDGQIVRERDKIVIKPVYQIRGDVDLSTGNIDFVGSVKIGGNVREGFEIKAAGDVEINGNVGAARIEATGNVLIKKGFLGRSKGEISAEGDVNARFVENANIKANNVRVHEAIMHSKVTAKDSVIVTGGKGLIVGGRIIAQNLVEANLIGSSLATKTFIEIGLEPELKKRYTDLKSELTNLENNLDKVEKSIDLLKSIQQSGKKLPANKEEMFFKLKKTKLELKNNQVELTREFEQLKEALTASEKAVIKVNESIFPGVQLLSSKDKMIIRNKISQAAFSEINKELRQTTI